MCAEQANYDHRIVVLMPTQKDAARTASALQREGLIVSVVSSFAELCNEIEAGVGAVLLPEEAIIQDKPECLKEVLSHQPTWSSVPLIVLSHERRSLARQEHFDDLPAIVTLIERPLHFRTLLSVVQAALRTRRQQYDIRDALEERERQAAELRVSEERQRFLAELATATQVLTDPDEIMAVTARMLGEHLDVDRCAYADVESERVFVITGNYTRNVPSIVGRWGVADFGPEIVRLMAENQPYVMDDVNVDERAGTDLSAYKATTIQAAICVPLHKDGRFVAAMAVHQQTPRHWKPNEIDLVVLVVGRCWEAIERARVARSLAASETQFRAVFESSLDAILVADDSGRYIAANAAACELLGTPHDELLQRSIVDFMEPGFDFTSAWREFFTEGRQRGVIRLVRPDGAIREAEFSATREMRTGHHLSMLRDVTDRRRDEAKLRKQTDRLRLLWEAAALLLTTDDPNAMIRGVFTKIAPHFDIDTYFNFMVDETGEALRLESCAGIPDEVAGEIGRLQFGQAVCGTVALRRAPLTVTSIQDSDDPKVQLVKSFGIRAYSCSPLLAGDRLLGTLSFASRTRDSFDDDEIEFLRTISRYVTVAYERLRLIEELRDSDRRKDEFLALLAHELRNPLAPLRNSLNLLQLMGYENANTERICETMERQVNHLVRLVDDLLEVSRITRGKIDLRREAVELATVVRNAVETSRPLIDAGGVQLAISLPQEPILLYGDPIRLAQIFANLLNNAAKYNKPGGQIWFTAHKENDSARISVRDSGIGISPEVLPKVFDMFMQGDRSANRSHGGLGIGLTLVRSLVELNEGSVTAKSDGQGCGTEFVISLPLADMDRSCTVDRQSSPADQGSPVRRILVVDDNVDAANSLGTLLQHLGGEVEIAHDGPAALTAIDKFRPNFVLLDIGMPEMDGFEVAKRVRECRDFDNITLIALTGWGQENDRRRTREAGFDHHLVKPADLNAIQSLLLSYDSQ
jgi:PAS domain S-box-containing protein